MAGVRPVSRLISQPLEEVCDMTQTMGFVMTAVIAMLGFILQVNSPAVCAQAMDAVIDATPPMPVN
jgi:hypothetical protein